MEHQVDEDTAQTAGVPEGKCLCWRCQRVRTTTPSPASPSMPKPELSSGLEYALKVGPFTSPTSPVSSAAASSSEPELVLSFIDRALTDLGSVLKRKNSDYKVTSSEFSNFHYAADVAGISAREVMMAQIGIKLGRLRGLLDTGKDPNWES